MSNPLKAGDRILCVQGAENLLTAGEEYTVGAVKGGRVFISGTYDNGDHPISGAEHTRFQLATPTVPTGRKDDGGKLDMTLLDDMPRAIAAVVEVMQWAITKKEPTPYVRSSWLGVSADRYRAAVYRHLSAAAQQYSYRIVAAPGTSVNRERDHETNLLHLAHTACSALMALENTLREIEKEQKDGIQVQG